MTEHPLQPFLDAGIGVLDGGLATELERRGADLRDALWSARVLLESPDSIVEVHESYFEAGADVAITASYQASEVGFASRGIDRAGTAALLGRSVALAREARDRWLGSERGSARRRPRPIVAASVGPFGAVLADGSEYTGDYGVSREDLREFHLARLEALVEAGPDLLAIETIPSLLEAEAIAQALTTFGDALPAWGTFTLRDPDRIADGSALSDAVAAITTSPSVVAVGVNCSPPSTAVAAVSGLSATTSLPIVVYPNRGVRWNAAARTWDGSADVDLARVSRDAVGAGAGFVGGCCGTGPDDIRAIAAATGARPSEVPR